MDTSRQIYLVQANSEIESAILQCLKREGCAPVLIAPDQDLPAHAQAIIIVDSPKQTGLDGWKLCRHWRHLGFNGRILLLALEGRRHMVTDDGVTVETPPIRLAAAIAHLVQQLSGSDAAWRIGPWRLDQRGRELLHLKGQRQKLTQKEMELLLRLVFAGTEGLPAEDILIEVWGYRPGVSSHTLASHVYRLRQKLGDGLLTRTDQGCYRLEQVQAV